MREKPSGAIVVSVTFQVYSTVLQVFGVSLYQLVLMSRPQNSSGLSPGWPSQGVQNSVEVGFVVQELDVECELTPVPLGYGNPELAPVPTGLTGAVPLP